MQKLALTRRPVALSLAGRGGPEAYRAPEARAPERSWLEREERSAEAAGGRLGIDRRRGSTQLVFVLACTAVVFWAGCTNGPDESGPPPFVRILQGVTLTQTATNLPERVCMLTIPVGLASPEYEICHYGERMVESRYGHALSPPCSLTADLVSAGAGGWDLSSFFRLTLVRTGSSAQSWDRWRAAVLLRDDNIASPPSGRWLYGLGTTTTAPAVACPTGTEFPDLPPEYLTQTQCFKGDSKQANGTIAAYVAGGDCTQIQP